MRINYGGGNEIGNGSHPIYLNSDGEPMVCNNVLGVGITGGLFDITGQAITSFTKPEDEGKKPVYFRDGQPLQCDDTLDVSILGNAATATNADSATHAVEADSATIADGAYFLLDLNNPQVSLNTGNQKLPVYFNDGVPVECDKFLPLSAGEQYKINGPLGLTVKKNYGTLSDLDELSNSSDSGFEGEIFFVEDPNNYLYLPTGGVSGNVLIKNSSTDGDASWVNLNNKFLPSGGSSGQVLVKNSSTDGDAKWTTLSNSYLPLSGGTLTGPLSGTYYVTTNYGTANPTSSTPGHGVNGALYFKIIS